MSFALQYKPLIESEKKLGKSLIKPGNIYRIMVYKYADGVTKSLSGPTSALIFAIGIYDKQLFCLKISEIKPEKFFKWLKLVFLKNLNDENFDTSQHLMELLVKADKSGKKLYSSYVKPSTIAKGPLNPYRTYNLSGITLVQEVKIKKEILKKYYK
jgi:hypothetical protein